MVFRLIITRIQFALVISLIIPHFASAQSQAQSHQKLQLQTVTCGPQALKLLQKWEALDEWRMKFTENESIRKFQGPTRHFGHWIQVEYQDQKNLKLIQFSESKQLEFQFDSKCEPQMKDLTLDQVRKPASQIQQTLIPRMNDTEIASVVKKKASAVFFLWSPHMQISIEALKEIVQATSKLKVPLYAMVDPKADFKMAQNIAKRLKIPKAQLFIFDSFELTLRDFRLHYPSMIVASQGRFPSAVQRGHETAKVYEDYIRTQF